MPYKPAVRGAHEPGRESIGWVAQVKKGDFGDYAFSGDLSVGDRNIFEDMMHRW